jgi:hypothetical protein
MGVVVENGTVSHLKKFVNFLINLKIIKIIIIKNKKYKNLKKLKGWPATPLLTMGVAGANPLADLGWMNHPIRLWGWSGHPQKAKKKKKQS